MKREDKKWSKKRIGMLDPYATKRNLCRSLNTQVGCQKPITLAVWCRSVFRVLDPVSAACGQHGSGERSERWRAVGDILSDLTD